jgi:hypothetical protein
MKGTDTQIYARFGDEFQKASIGVVMDEFKCAEITWLNGHAPIKGSWRAMRPVGNIILPFPALYVLEDGNYRLATSDEIHSASCFHESTVTTNPGIDAKCAENAQKML